MTQINHSERAHALLGASSAKRWMSCPPSALLADKFPQTTSKYAEEGTKAHEIAEQCLQAFLEGKAEPTYKDDDLRIREELTPYIDGIIETFNAEKAINADAVLFLETKVDFCKYVPNGFGTADVIILSDSRMYVIDLKFGKGVPVDAEGNPQLRLYGLGAYHFFEDLYDIKHVLMEIRQPRLDHFSSELMTTEDIIKWGTEVVAPKARLAIEGKGEFACGDWCQFCPVKTCKHRATSNLNLVEENTDPAVLSKEEISNILEKLNQVSKWVSSLTEYATEQLASGEEIPGWKLVEGKSNRKYEDQDKVVAKLKSENYAESFIFEKVLLGITKMEKVLGKKIFTELLGDLVIKPAGAPTLAPESDKRHVFNNQQTLLNSIEIPEGIEGEN